jgi:hypothetical protein
MMNTADKGLVLIEQELRFIACRSQEIEGSYDVVDRVNLAVISALRALKEYKLKHQPAREGTLSDVGLAT